MVHTRVKSNFSHLWVCDEFFRLIHLFDTWFYYLFQASHDGNVAAPALQSNIFDNDSFLQAVFSIIEVVFFVVDIIYFK